MFWFGLFALCLVCSWANGKKVASNGARRQRNEGGGVIAFATFISFIAVLIVVL